MFSFLKGKIYAIGAAILALLLGVIKFLLWRNSSLKERVETAEADLKFRNDISTIDEEIESDFSDLRREAEKDIQDGEIPAHLRKPDPI